VAWTDMTQLTGLVAWYKPETLAATYANGDPISTWADSSGNSHDMSNTLTARPTALSNAFGTYMGADFDGIDDYLISGSYTQNGQLIVSVVISFDGLTNYQIAASVGNQSPPVWNSGLGNKVWVDCIGWGTGRLSTYSFLDANVSRAETTSTTSSGYSVGQDYILSYASNTYGDFVRTNGFQNELGVLTINPSHPTSDTAYISLGYNGLDFLNGMVSEVVIYNNTNAYFSDLIWVEGYLADKYAITLADGHLFKNAAPENAPTTYNATGGAGSSRLVNGGLVD